MVSKFFCKPIVCLLIDPHEVLDVVRDQSLQQWDYRKSCYISNTLMQIYHIHVYLEKMNSSIFWANFKFICPNIYHFEYNTSISQTGCYIPFGWLKYTCMFWSCMQALKSEWNINHTIADFLDLHYVVPWISYSIKWFIHICSPYKTL